MHWILKLPDIGYRIFDRVREYPIPNQTSGSNSIRYRIFRIFGTNPPKFFKKKKRKSKRKLIKIRYNYEKINSLQDI